LAPFATLHYFGSGSLFLTGVVRENRRKNHASKKNSMKTTHPLLHCEPLCTILPRRGQCHCQLLTPFRTLAVLVQIYTIIITNSQTFQCASGPATGDLYVRQALDSETRQRRRDEASSAAAFLKTADYSELMTPLICWLDAVVMHNLLSFFKTRQKKNFLFS
jgi:hypothetical protein